MPKEKKQPTILVIDDSEVNQIMLSSLLEEEYTVLSAFSGEQGIEMIAENLPDLVFLDIIMPGQDGYAVCRHIMQDPKTAGIPIIFITSMDSPEDIQKGFTSGAVDYITKPFNGAEVLARTRTHLALKGARESLEKQNAVLKETIAEQEINIGLARKILNYISSTPPRYIRLGEGLALCLHWLSISCKTEGGDNLFVRKLPPHKSFPRGKTIISIKDQSGHAVNCMLRNIITDLIHNILHNSRQEPPARVITRLNKTICRTKIFKEDQFFTTITAEVDHASLLLNFVSAGHPPFFLIRGSEVKGYPHPGGTGNNLPVGIIDNIEFESGQVQLLPGDKLLFYTDGLPEMPVKQEKLILGFHELRDLVGDIVRQNPLLPISKIIDELIRRMAELSRVSLSATENTSNDDVTILGVEIENSLSFLEIQLTPADFADIDALIAFAWKKISGDFAAHGLEKLHLKIRTAFGEALLNAWKHGHKKNAALPLTIRWRHGNDFTFEVIDQGPGFDFRNLSDPTAPENLVAESGRGIFMILNFAQFVKWKQGGRHIQVTFVQPSENMLEISDPNKSPNLWGSAIKQ